jgi:signal transduction histidine kinase
VLKRARVDLGELLRRCVDAIEPRARVLEHHVELQLPDAPITLDGDEIRLDQVFANLVGNAVKYTPAGGHILVRLTRSDDAAVVSVRDDGAGISAETLPYVFDLFAQAKPTLDRSQGGLGIGLTLVRMLVQLHGGSVEAHSEGLGRGSEFTVRLPLADETPR